MRTVVVVLTLLVVCWLGVGVLGRGDECSGAANNAAPYAGPQTLVATVPNGKKFMAGPTGNQITVVHLYGTPVRSTRRT